MTRRTAATVYQRLFSPSPGVCLDADECALFGPEVCKGGFCLDTVGSYECYCKTGQDYDLAKLECRG